MESVERPTRYRVRWEDGGRDLAVLVDADRATRVVELNLPGGRCVTVDVVTARAVLMLLSHVVYSVLEPAGPWLGIEAHRDGDWTTLQRPA